MRRITSLATIGVGLAACAAMTVFAQDRAPIRTVKGGIVDEVQLYAEKLPASTRVVIRPFSATDADIVTGEKKDETKTMQKDGPGILSARFVEQLKSAGGFSDVAALEPGAPTPADALIVEGKFTELDPGSQAKRIFVGYGAGKSGVSVEGSVKSADGTLLATFKQRRIGVMGGGSNLQKLEADTKAIGEDLAKLLSAWAKGKSLK